MRSILAGIMVILLASPASTQSSYQVFTAMFDSGKDINGEKLNKSCAFVIVNDQMVVTGVAAWFGNVGFSFPDREIITASLDNKIIITKGKKTIDASHTKQAAFALKSAKIIRDICNQPSL